MQSAIHFDILNTLQQSGEKIKTTVTTVTKLKEVKKLYAQQCGFTANDYTTIFCYDQYDLYETIIFAIVESYTNIIGKPHIVCSNMEHVDIISILDKLVKSAHITCTYIHVDIYGAVPVANVQAAITTNTALVIVSYSNYLTGTTNDITAISAATQKSKVPLFCDCIYSYGKCGKLQQTDVFSISFGCVSMLTIKNTLVEGYKLKHHCDELQDGAEKLLKITNSECKQITQALVSKRFNNTVDTKEYLLSQLAIKYKLIYYDILIAENIIPTTQNAVIFGHKDSTTSTVSLLFMSSTATVLKSKLVKKNIYIACVPKPFEHIGLLTKWCKHVITLNLDNVDKKNIDAFVATL